MMKIFLLIFFLINSNAWAQNYIRANQYNPLNQGNNSCDTGGMFVSTGNTIFNFTPLNGGSSVYTPACLRDPYIRLYFGTYYALYSEGVTYLDIATASSLIGTWTRINHISIGSALAFGVNVPEFIVDQSGGIHVTIWDGQASEWWEIHPSSSDPSTFSSSWSTKANIYDSDNNPIVGTENLYITQYNNIYYLLSSPSQDHLTIRTSNDVTTGWSGTSTLSVPGLAAPIEGEVPIFIGGNLAVSWAYDDNSTHFTPLSYSVNSAGSSGTWGSIVQVAPTDSYGEVTPTTDMACGTAGQLYQSVYLTAPSSNLCAVGSASAVTGNGSSWVWTCTLSANVAQCSAQRGTAVISNAVIRNATI